MGYFVDYSINELRIKKKNIPAALAAINQMHTDEELLNYARGGTFGKSVDDKPIKERKWYSWVDNPKGDKFETITEAIEAWGLVDEMHPCEIDSNGDFILDGYYSNKLGQQELLFKRIAPFTEDILIECRGEDGSLWAWQIDSGEFIELSGHVTYK